MSSAFTFPSMGTQEAGMGREYYEESETFRTQFDRLDEATTVDLANLCFDRSADELAKPRNAEPAIAAVSYCFGHVAREQGYTPDYIGGLSLGQFTALAFAGAIEPDALVSLVRKRGELIEQLGGDNGIMTAVITDGVDRVSDHVESFDALSIGVRATPQGCVVSGDADEFEALLAELEGTAPFVETIPVEGITEGFHSPLLEPVVPEFRALIEEYEFSDEFQYPVVSDVTGEVRTDAEGLRDELADSLVSTARIDWVLETMQTAGVDTYVQMFPEGRLAAPIAELHPDAELLSPDEV